MSVKTIRFKTVVRLASASGMPNYEIGADERVFTSKRLFIEASLKGTSTKNLVYRGGGDATCREAVSRSIESEYLVYYFLRNLGLNVQFFYSLNVEPLTKFGINLLTWSRFYLGNLQNPLDQELKEGDTTVYFPARFASVGMISFLAMMWRYQEDLELAAATNKELIPALPIFTESKFVNNWNDYTRGLGKDILEKLILMGVPFTLNWRILTAFFLHKSPNMVPPFDGSSGCITLTQKYIVPNNFEELALFVRRQATELKQNKITWADATPTPNGMFFSSEFRNLILKENK